MATWTVSINNHINESSNADRAKQVFVLIKDELLGASTAWTLIAYGSGTGGSYAKDDTGLTDPFPSFPNITGGTEDVNDNSWIVIENADGEQVIIQVSSNYLHLFWSCSNSYLKESTGPWDDASATVRPGDSTTPADEVDHGSFPCNAGYTATYYASIAVSDDGNSFIFFAKTGTDSIGIAFVKVEDTKTGDTHPYWSFMDSGSSTFDDSVLSSASSGDDTKSYHPSGGQLRYTLARPYSYQDIMDNMVVDPYTGNEQLVEPLCVCEQSPYNHIRGKVPGFVRNSSARSMGDTFNSGEYMCMGEWSVPWNGTTTSLQ